MGNLLFSSLPVAMVIPVAVIVIADSDPRLTVLPSN